MARMLRSSCGLCVLIAALRAAIGCFLPCKSCPRSAYALLPAPIILQLLFHRCGSWHFICIGRLHRSSLHALKVLAEF
jgi:hypothetical protein